MKGLASSLQFSCFFLLVVTNFMCAWTHFALEVCLWYFPVKLVVSGPESPYRSILWSRISFRLMSCENFNKLGQILVNDTCESSQFYDLQRKCFVDSKQKLAFCMSQRTIAGSLVESCVRVAKFCLKWQHFCIGVVPEIWCQRKILWSTKYLVGFVVFLL